MAELIVVGFKKDMYRAAEVLNVLKDLNDSWAVDLNDAVAVYRDYNGKLRVDSSFQLTMGQGGAWGGLLGGLVGAILLAPFTGGASLAVTLTAGTLSGAAIGATAGVVGAEAEKEDYGISDDFVHEVGNLVQPGDSAIFALLRVVKPEVVAAQFKGYGGTILRTNLSDADRARVEANLQAQ